jgi:NADH dehydrogenase (ubiquinone) flavoprotein 1
MQGTFKSKGWMQAIMS